MGCQPSCQPNISETGFFILSQEHDLPLMTSLRAVNEIMWKQFIKPLEDCLLSQTAYKHFIEYDSIKVFLLSVPKID